MDDDDRAVAVNQEACENDHPAPAAGQDKVSTTDWVNCPECGKLSAMPNGLLWSPCPNVLNGTPCAGVLVRSGSDPVNSTRCTTGACP